MAIVGRHPHETAGFDAADLEEIERAAADPQRAGDRRDRPRLLPRPRPAGRPAARLRGPARARRAARAAGGDPHPRGRGRHLRDPARARGAPPGGDPALLLRPGPARRVRRARLPLLVRRQRHLPEGDRPPGEPPAKSPPSCCWSRPTRPTSRPSPCAASRTSPPTWRTRRAIVAELRGVSYEELERTVEANAARVFGW